MSRIAQTFSRLSAAHRTALIPFVVAGDPDLATTEQLLGTLVRGGADLIEAGIPFSDPIADGPINQRASQRALASGVTVSQVFDLLRRMRFSTPVVLLSYYNLLVRYGLEKFCAHATASGVDGVVIPDLPPDEADDLLAAARPADLDTIFLLAPTSTDARIQLAAQRSSGFLYCVSLTGVTGIRDRLSEDARQLVERVRRVTKLPICVGFGVSTPEQARQVAEVADGVIVGSALVQQLEESGDRLGRAEQFVRELRRSIDAVGAGKVGPP